MPTTVALPPPDQATGAVSLQNVAVLPQYVTVHRASKIWKTYARWSSLVLGVTQISSGILCIFFNAMAIAAGSEFAVVCHGIWGGMFFILSGTFGVVARNRRTTCTIVTFMVLSILAAALFAPTVINLSLGSIANDLQNIPFKDAFYGRNFTVAMDSMVGILALIEMVVAIVSSAVCCASVCCGRRQQPHVITQQSMLGNEDTHFLVSACQTGNADQQGVTADVGQQQHFGGAPKNKDLSAPPPYPQIAD